MGKKLSAIIVGVIILVGVVTTMTFLKGSQTAEGDYLVKDDTTKSTMSEEAQDSSVEDEETVEEQASLEDDSDTEEQSSKDTKTSTKENRTADKSDATGSNAKASDKSNQSDATDSNTKASDTDKLESDATKEESSQAINDSSEFVDAGDTNKSVAAVAPKSRINSESKSDSSTDNNSNQTPETNTASDTTSSGSYLSDVEQLIYQKVNNERANAGLSTLSNSSTMQKYARIKSADMGDRNYFAHEDPNGDLITTVMKQGGVSYNAWGENIAYIGGVSGAEALAEQFMTNWMNSSGHRANILSSDYDSIGIGVYQIGNTVYATQEFMR